MLKRPVTKSPKPRKKPKKAVEAKESPPLTDSMLPEEPASVMDDFDVSQKKARRRGHTREYRKAVTCKQ